MVTTDKKLRVGVIGIGFACERLHFPAFQKLTDKYEIVAVCNKGYDKAAGFSKGISLPESSIYTDFTKLLERTDIDVVDLLVPISENYEIAEAVIKAKKNLIAEKPFASNPDAAKALIDLKNEYNVKVIVAENFRYEEENNIIKDIINKGTIGEIMYFIQNTGADFQNDMSGNTFAAKEWRQHPKYKGGIFLDGGIHDIARMRYLFGDISSIYACGRTQQEEYNKYISINTLIKFKNNVAGMYSFYSQGADKQTPPVGLRIFGTLGSVYLESKSKGVIEVFYNDGKIENMNFTPAMGYFNELLNFYDAMVTNKEIVSTPEKELGDIEAIYNILQSIEKDNIVK